MSSFHPQTPRSPSQSSPSTGGDNHPSVNTSMTSVSTLPTPAHSVNGSSMSADMASCLPNEASMMTIMGDESPQKRKRPLDDMGDREQKKVHIEDRRLGIEALHQDVGPKYKICQPRPPPRFPIPTVDLIDEYGLNDIAAGVARILPNGEKNAMRKSYKGAFKKLKIQGDFEPVSREWKTDRDHFSAFLSLPEEEWHNLFVRGKDVSQGFSDDVKNGLRRATALVRGPMPPGEWDSKVLGVLSADKLAGNKTQSVLKGTVARTTPNTPLHPAKPQQPVGAQEARPRRGFSKRKYDDASFDGYRDTFEDDPGMDTGYSTAEGEGGQKRRKKNSGPTQFSGSMRQQSYGPGMVGA